MRLAGRYLAFLCGLAALLILGPGQSDAARDDHQTHPALVAPPELTRTFGSTGSEPGEFRDPWHVAHDGQGRVIVADTGNNRIQVFDARGAFLFLFGSEGSAAGEFDGPRGVAVAADDRIVVSDSGNHRIQIFSSDGQFESEFGSQGSGVGQLESPSGVHVTDSGEIVVADTGNNRVETFSDDGSRLMSIGSLGTGNGELDAPVDVAIGRQSLVYVAEQSNDRVSVFDAAGGFQRFVEDVEGQSDLFSEPTSITIDDHDMVYISDPTNGRIQVFAAQQDHGYYTYKWQIAEEDSTNISRSIAVNAEGKLFVVDAGENHLERWKYFRCMGRRATHVGTPGPDSLWGHPYDAVLVGRGGDDRLSGGFGEDFICGGEGNDTIYGGWQADFVQGGPGRDVIEGGRGADELRGGRGRDRIHGRASGDSIFGGAGNDAVFGGDGDDSVFGGAGDDWVRGGQGNDLLDGEAGTDTCEGGRGKADEFVSCEEVLDRPAPSGWYWVRNLRAGFDRGIDIDPATGLLWGVDSSFLTGHIVGAQDHTGRRVVEYQVGGDEGLAVYPIAVQVFDGELYVLGRDSQRVVVMGTDGTLRRHWGGPGAAPGEFESPCDIVVTETQVIVSERSGRFQVFDHDGMYESEFTGATNACRFGHLNDELYVADFNRHKVFVYSVGGELQRRIGSGLLRYPRAIDTSPASGLVWVGGNHSDIYALTPSGDLVHTISGFETVMALTVDGSDHAVWTTHWVTCCHGEIRNRADVYTDLSCAGRRIEFIGTAYDDSMVLNGGNRIMHGGPGDDLIDAGNGDDYICGGQGADTLLGRSGDDFLFGQGGADKLRGGAGDDSCDGGQGDDELFGCEVAGVPR